jgi:4-amino-4-deoxy-L-arabinose transferase-like glycosyltransferase
VPGDPPGLIIPQFYPLHPTWLAVFHSLGGTPGNLLATPWWALLASLAVYLAARELFGRRAACLALAGLTITALQVWFARYPTAEMLTQFLVWMGIYALAAWLSGRQPARLWALVAGASLGEVLLTRIDTYFLVAIPIVLGLWLRWRSQRPAAAAWFFVPFLGLTAHSLVHARLFSWPYFVDTYARNFEMLRRYALPLGIIALLGIAALLVLDRRPAVRAGIVARWPQARPIVLGSAVIATMGLAVYSYWVRPHLGGATQMAAYWYGGGEIPVNLDRENLVRLGWYLSPWGLALGVGGACLSLWKMERKTALFVAAGLFYSVLYLWRIQANPHQIYTMRRYVPVVLPFATVCAGYLLAWLSERPARWQRWAALGGSLAWLCLLAWLARGFVSQVDFQGIGAQLEVLNGRLAPHSILLFDDQAPIGQGDILGTPLRFLYGHDVFSVRQPAGQSYAALAQQVERWRAAGRTVYWLTPAAQDAQSASPEAQGKYRVAVQVLESSYEARPQRRIEARWQGTLALITGPGLAHP